MSCGLTTVPPTSEIVKEAELHDGDSDDWETEEEENVVDNKVNSDPNHDPWEAWDSEDEFADSDGSGGLWTTEDDDSNSDSDSDRDSDGNDGSDSGGNSSTTQDDDNDSDVDSWMTMFEDVVSNAGSDGASEGSHPWSWAKDWWRHDFEGHRIFMILTPLRPNGFAPEAWEVHDEASEAVVATLNAANLSKLTVYNVPAQTAFGPGVVLQLANPNDVHVWNPGDPFKFDDTTRLFEAINACTLVSVTMDCADDQGSVPNSWPWEMIATLVSSFDQPHLIGLDLGCRNLGEEAVAEGLRIVLPRLPSLQHLTVPIHLHDEDGSFWGPKLLEAGTTSLLKLCDHGGHRDMGDIFNVFAHVACACCDCGDLKRNGREWSQMWAYTLTRNRFLHQSVQHAVVRAAVDTRQLLSLLNNAKPAEPDTPDRSRGITDLPPEVLQDIAIYANGYWALTTEQTARAALETFRWPFPPSVTREVWANRLAMRWDQGNNAGSAAFARHGREWEKRYYNRKQNGHRRN